MDYIGVKRVDAGGDVVGELRLIGLFTSKAYMEPASRVPILRRKFRQIVAADHFLELRLGAGRGQGRRLGRREDAPQRVLEQ